MLSSSKASSFASFTVVRLLFPVHVALKHRKQFDVSNETLALR